MRFFSASFILMFTVIGSAALADEGRKLEAYPISNPNPDEIVSTAKSIAGTNGTVVFIKDISKLVVSATPAVHEQIIQLLSKTEMKPVNIQLDVAFDEASESRDSGASIKTEGGIIITPRKTGYKVKIDAEAHDNKINGISLTHQLLMLRSGTEGFIQVGEDIPYLDTIIEMGRNWGYITSETKFMNTGARLRVKANLLGDGENVSVKLVPEIAGLVSNKIQAISFIRMETEVTVKNGETIDIGSFGEKSDFYNKFLAGYKRGKASKSVKITLSANLIDASGQPALKQTDKKSGP